jgi:methylmalonyl-CoA mutase
MPELFSEFKPASAAEWKAQVEKELKGEAFENLIWKNENGFDIYPFYTAEDLRHNYAPAFTHANWEICVKGKSEDSKTLNKQLLKQLNSGASSISLHIKNLDLETALKDIQLNYIQSTFYADVQSLPGLMLYLEKNYDLNELKCSIFNETNNSKAELEQWLTLVSKYKYLPNIKTITFDGLAFHNGNCHASYEVAILLSGLIDCIDVLSGHNVKTEAPFVIKTGVNSDYFMQIAKLRAIRRLWLLLKSNYGVKNDLHVIVETGLTNKSISDSYNNLLRTSYEAMAAVLGGCNELIVNSFDDFFPVSETLADRLAINQQLILKDESYFDKMADVSCGSYYIEKLTDLIATKALDTIKSFEKQGGYFSCLEKNVIDDEIQNQAAGKKQRLETKTQIVVGVNKFKNEKETIQLSAATIEQLEHLPINNPTLDFELTHYFKTNA